MAYASGNEITFYASLLPNELGTGPVKFDIKASGSDLVETTWQPDSGSGGSGSTCTERPRRGPDVGHRR